MLGLEMRLDDDWGVGVPVNDYGTGCESDCVPVKIPTQAGVRELLMRGST